MPPAENEPLPPPALLCDSWVGRQLHLTTKAPMRYEFNNFTFVSQEIKRGSRLRLVMAPVNSIYMEKNYNTGGVAAQETVKDARAVWCPTENHEHSFAGKGEEWVKYSPDSV